ncbi:uncharacterized protein LOC126853381 isoform X3 [Cataglyphis hispanica]|uniref:uncharacterized protein LOC126853381 isoform X3 n=1 Tax=Cataglyphis hispanica TaxID=1086592 RepID=UPI00217FA252|nr:uncharacterized protein LOC126853381 isoform X3 [Cataglyphis hispanica]
MISIHMCSTLPFTSYGVFSRCCRNTMTWFHVALSHKLLSGCDGAKKIHRHGLSRSTSGERRRAGIRKMEGERALRMFNNINVAVASLAVSLLEIFAGEESE